MVSGTFVLTDTINAGVQRRSSRRRTRRRTPSSPARQAFGGSQNAPSFPASTLDRVQALPGCRGGRGRDRRPGAVRRHERQGDRAARRRAGPRVQRHRTATTRFNPLTLVSRHLAAGAGRGRGRRAHRLEAQRSRSAARSGCCRAAARSSSSASPAIVAVRELDSLGGATLAIFDLPTAQKLFHKEGELDQIDVAREVRRTPTATLARPDPVGAAAEHAGAHRPGAGAAGDEATRATSSRSSATSCSPSAGSRSSSVRS